MAMQARVKWVENVTLMGESGSGHTVIMDGSPEIGGRNIGIRPMELVLLGLGGCTALDVLTILKKARQPVTDCWIKLKADRSETIPQVFTAIHVHFVIVGDRMSETQVARAVNLSAEKYCSVSQMLGKTATISHDFEIRPTRSDPDSSF